MKLKDLYNDINKNIINILYNKLKKFKLKKKIITNLNHYDIFFKKVTVTLPLDTRFTILKKNFNLSKYNSKSFSIHWDKYFDTHTKWFKYINNYNAFNNKYDQLIYNKLILSKFISQSVINNIIKRTHYYCMITNNNRNIIIFGNNKNEIKNYMMKCLSVLDFFNIFYIDNTKLNLYIFLSDIKKIFPNDNFYTPYHVNTAYSIKKSEIVIFRKEEFEKVLFHELIHFYDLDILNYQQNLITKFPKFKFKFNPNEAYTDFFAIIFHILYVHYITNKSLKDLIKIELGFINNQVKQIYKLTNSTSFNQMLDNYNQSTSVFSYYIIKSAMFSNEKLLNTIDINKLYIDYMQIFDSFMLKTWKKIFNVHDVLNSNSLKMSFISKYL